MLIKISLALAIIVSLATLYVAHDQVQGRIISLEDASKAALADAGTSKKEATDARKAEKEAQGELDSAKKKFAEQTALLDLAVTNLFVQTARADKSAAELKKATEDRNATNSVLSSFLSLNLSVDQIRPLIAELPLVKSERDALLAESKVLARTTRMLKAELDKYKGFEEVEVVLPAGTKGEIVAVDPKFDFVVLNIGKDQGLLQNAKLLVNRNGKLVGKVKITSVEDKRSIANVLSDWKQDDLLEGDQVFY